MRRYEQWLKEQNVWWDERLQLRPPESISEDSQALLAGWGVKCLAHVPRGCVVIRVPRAAVFSTTARIHVAPRADDHTKPVRIVDMMRSAGVTEDLLEVSMESDCQAPLAVALLLAREDPMWWPKLRPEVTPRSCPVVWASPSKDDASAESMGDRVTHVELTGTELEHVVKAKHNRLRREFESLEGVLPRHCTFSDYVDACAVVMSRVQPWWGGSFVPFVDQANHSWGHHHLEFHRRGNEVIGRSVRRIDPGEVFQSYGELSTADALYRYGFTPVAEQACNIRSLKEDVVTVRIDELEKAAVMVLSEQGHACEEQGTCDDKIASRRGLMARAALLEESPWDGMDGFLGIELAAESKGLRELLAAGALLILDASTWERVAAAAGEAAAAAEAAAPNLSAARREKRAAAAVAKVLAAAVCGEHARACADCDWTLLLPHGLAWASDAACQVVAQALRLRDRCYHGQRSIEMDESLYDEAASAEQGAAAWSRRGLLQLRIVERRLLSTALSALASRHARAAGDNSHQAS